VTRVVRFHETGGPEVLRVEELELPAPGPGEVRVRHTAIGLNYVDTYHRSGLYPPGPLPAELGMEAAGVVERVGPGVTEFELGQRVGYATGRPGAYAEARNVQAVRLIPLPDGVDEATAAAILLKGMTAEYLVRRTYPVQAGQPVLLHAAAGGVGIIASQWLAHLGATVIGTVGSDDKASLARGYGCHYPIVYTREDFVSRVRELTSGRGVPVVYDSVGRATFGGSLECLAPRGLLVSFGNASGKPDPIDPGVLGTKGSLYLTRPSLFTYVATRAELLASAQALFEMVLAGAIKVRIGQRWPLAQVVQAHRALESRATTGSTVLTV
jgi:NADPH2:quinone reductase